MPGLKDAVLQAERWSPESCRLMDVTSRLFRTHAGTAGQRKSEVVLLEPSGKKAKYIRDERSCRFQRRKSFFGLYSRPADKGQPQIA